MTDSPILAVAACENIESALALGRALVEAGLAACSTAIPGAISIYRWEGKLEESSEVVLLIKSRKEKRQALESRILELHSYSTPEFIAIDIDAINAKYRDWLLSMTP